MKHTLPDPFLTGPFLCFVRDNRPAVSECMARIGEEGFHLLRKHGLLIVDDNHCRLNHQLLSPDGTRFVWGQKVIHLDDDLVELVRWGPDGPPVWNEEP